MKQILNFTPFTFQEKSINDLIDIINLNNGGFIWDETGLGKTITSLTTAINISNDILIISPKYNQGSWNYISNIAKIQYPELSIDVITAQSLHKVKSKYDFIIIDEVHNYRNLKSKTVKDLFLLIHNNHSKTLLLSATPYNNNFKEFKTICNFLCLKNDSLAFHTLGKLMNEIIELENKIKTFDRFNLRFSSFKSIGELVTLEGNLRGKVTMLKTVLSSLTVRNTRAKIKELYPNDISMMGSFPKINNFDKLEVKYESGFYEKIDKTVKLINKMKLVRQNIINYIIIKNINNKTDIDFCGIYKSLLFKRLESSTNSFKSTIGRGLSELYEFKKSIVNGKIELGGTYYGFYNLDLLYSHIEDDIRDFTTLNDLWSTENDLPKLDALKGLLETLNGKTIIFTEYKDTFDILINKFPKALTFDSSTSENVLETIRKEFDNNVPLNERTNKYNLLICTDVLSEGINLHQANNIVHYDNKWNPSKITQRNGRIDRITINSNIPKDINVYSFQVDCIIEDIIKLQNKIDTKNHWSDVFKSIDYNSNPFELKRFEPFLNMKTLSVKANVHSHKISKIIRNSSYDFMYSDSVMLNLLTNEMVINKNMLNELKKSKYLGYIDHIERDIVSIKRSYHIDHFIREAKLLKSKIRDYVSNQLYMDQYESILKELFIREKLNACSSFLINLDNCYNENQFIGEIQCMNVIFTEKGIIYEDQILIPLK
jgi:superfamily II DNA or RNA helicase